MLYKTVVSLILCLPVRLVLAGSAIVQWHPNSEPDLAGYKIYYGAESRNYDTVVDVGNVTSHTIPDLVDFQIYYFALTAYDTLMQESELSEEVHAVIGTPNDSLDTTAPELTALVVMGSTQINVHFSEPVAELMAEDKDNYLITDGIDIIGGILGQDYATVHLVTSAHRDGSEYSLSVSNIRDLANPANAIADSSLISYFVPFAGSNTSVFFQQMLVPANGATVITQPLAPGVRYRITAEGAYHYLYPFQPGTLADAEWSKDGDFGSQWVNHQNSLLELLVNEQDVEWGEYNIDHIYTHELTGTGEPLSFRILDEFPADNDGHLIVTVETVSATD